WDNANKSLQAISDYQKEWGKNVLPPASKVNMEITYNKINIFFWLMIIYSMLGGLLILFSFIEVLGNYNSKSIIHKVILGLFYLVLVALLIHFIGLGIRWYLSGHAPWSNGYEAIIFISSIGVLGGAIMYRNRNAFIPASGAIVAMIMMGFAHG